MGEPTPADYVPDQDTTAPSPADAPPAEKPAAGEPSAVTSSATTLGTSAAGVSAGSATGSAGSTGGSGGSARSGPGGGKSPSRPRPAAGGGGDGDDRLPPQSLEAEMSLLGSMMLNREAIGEVVPIINRDQSHWLYREDHRLLFETLLDIYESNLPVDLVVLRDELKRSGRLQQVGGSEYIIACAQSVPTAVHAEHYAKIVRDKGMLRDLIGAVQQIADEAYTDSGFAAEILDRAEQRLFNVTEQRISRKAVPLADLVREVHELAMTGTAHEIVGASTGFTELDELTTGFHHGDLVILAARPSMGKTALGLNMAEHTAVDAGLPTAFFSMEMSAQQVAQRLVCSRARIDSHRFRKRMLNEEEKNRISYTCAELSESSLFIDDTPGMSPMELRAKARRLKMQHDLRIIFIDYLQLMHAPGLESRQQEIASISRALKALGRELNVPIVAMAQLNRQTEGRTGNTPRMSDLRESGAIEQDADVVLLIHREEYYKRDDPTLRGKAELILAKQRNGPTDTIELAFDHQCTRFNNYAHVPDTGYAPAPSSTPTSGEVPF